MDISRELAIQILKYLYKHKNFYFPFLVMNQECSGEDNDFVEIEPDEWKMIQTDNKYQTFQLWENLQDINKDTTKLMAKGFIEKIRGKSLEIAISRLAKEYKKLRKEDMWLAHKTADYGDNEFFDGSADAYENCLKLIKSFRN